MSDLAGTTFAYVALLLAIGAALGLLDRENFRPKWLLVAAAMVAINDLALTNFWGFLSPALESEWNWQGKLLATAATLVIAAHPAIGYTRAGITLRQRRDGRVLTIAVAALFAAVFLTIALLTGDSRGSAETLAFQATMPGFDEETFYRGILLLALAETFRARWNALGIDWNWGAVLSCIVFGLAHALQIDEGKIAFDAMMLLLTGGPALILIWFRERTGSVVLPILLHNFANAIQHIV